MGRIGPTIRAAAFAVAAGLLAGGPAGAEGPWPAGRAAAWYRNQPWPVGSRFDPALGYLKARKIGAENWGFVAGKSQTIYPWDSWKAPHPSESKVWFHDIFRPDGTPYDPAEVAYIRRVTGRDRP